MVESLKQMLRMSLKVSKNDLTEAVNLVQDAIQKTLINQPEQAREMYQLILGNLKSNNERLWFATSLRLGKIYLDEKSFEKLDQTLNELKVACRDPNDAMTPDSFDIKKGNLLLEVFALEIQMCIERKETRRMKEVFSLTKKFSSVIEDPRVVGIIKECGGKMYMSEKRWDAALGEFKESFERLVECGDPQAQTLLKYVILA